MNIYELKKEKLIYGNLSDDVTKGIPKKTLSNNYSVIAGIHIEQLMEKKRVRHLLTNFIAQRKLFRFAVIKMCLRQMRYFRQM